MGAKLDVGEHLETFEAKIADAARMGARWHHHGHQDHASACCGGTSWGKTRRPDRTSWSSAAASTAPASRATRPGRGLVRSRCVEQGDLASATSSWSSKLIHGGLRYLEQYEFSLVREALQEREVLLQLAPHIIRPLLFVLPHDASMRPAWMIRVGPVALRPPGRAHHAAGLEAVHFRTWSTARA